MNEVSMTYGYDRLRFTLPVFINDTISVTVTIRGLREHRKPGYGIVTELIECYNQHRALVMVCEHKLMVQKSMV
jgi:acyl dehydratase